MTEEQRTMPVVGVTPGAPDTPDSPPDAPPMGAEWRAAPPGVRRRKRLDGRRSEAKHHRAIEAEIRREVGGRILDPVTARWVGSLATVRQDLEFLHGVVARRGRLSSRQRKEFRALAREARRLEHRLGLGGRPSAPGAAEPEPRSYDLTKLSLSELRLLEGLLEQASQTQTEEYETTHRILADPEAVALVAALHAKLAGEAVTTVLFAFDPSGFPPPGGAPVPLPPPGAPLGALVPASEALGTPAEVDAAPMGAAPLTAPPGPASAAADAHPEDDVEVVFT